MEDGLLWLLPPLVAGLVLGAVIRRWWWLPLAPVIASALVSGGHIPFLPHGEGSDRDAEWAWALILLTGPALTGLVVGTGVGRRLAPAVRSAVASRPDQ